MMIHRQSSSRFARLAALVALGLSLTSTPALAADADALSALPTDVDAVVVDGRAFEVEVRMKNHGLDTNARGALRYQQRGQIKRFTLNTVRLDAGSYVLMVGGVRARQFNLGSEQDFALRFSSVPRPGQPDLDFDPLGAEIEIIRNGRVILTARMPTGPSA